MDGEKDFYDSFDNTWGNREKSSNAVKLEGKPTKFRTLFIVGVIQFVISCLAMFGKRFGLISLWRYGTIAEILISLVGVAVILSLGEYDKLFKEAGLYKFGVIVIDVIKEMLVPGGLSTVISLLGSVFGLLTLFRFCEASYKLLVDKNENVAESWLTYRSFYVYYVVATVVSMMLLFVPYIRFIRILALLAVQLVVLCSYIFSIWQLVLFRKNDIVLRGGFVQ